MSRTNFGPIDALIVAAYLLVSVVIGLMVRKYVSDMTTYIGAGRKVRIRYFARIAHGVRMRA